MSIVYEVCLDVEPQLAESLAQYMRDKHIGEVLGTGCFTTAQFERTGDREFRTRYIAASGHDLDRYLDHHAAHFRSDFLEHFPAGVAPSRKVWEILQSW